MSDVHDAKTRSENMSNIKHKDTQPELFIRKLLHANGFRFRLHVKYLPGKPDIVLPKYKAVIQVNGCYWHGHNCHLFKWPKTRKQFWQNKIEGNIARDKRVMKELTILGWRVLIIWECALKGKTKLSLDQVSTKIIDWLGSDSIFSTLHGNNMTAKSSLNKEE